MTQNYQFNDLITQAGAARKRGCTRAAIADLVKRGKLTTVVVAGRNMLLIAEIEKMGPKKKSNRNSKKALDNAKQRV